MKQQENYLDQSIRLSQDCIFIIDKHGRFEFGNDAFFRSLGYPENEIIGHNFITIIHPEYHDFVKQKWEEIQINGGERSFEMDFLQKDGSLKKVFISKKDMEIQGEKKYCMIAKDLSELKLIETLRESEEKFRVLLENIQDGVFIVHNHKIDYANEAFARTLGYSVDEIIGKNTPDLLVPEENELLENKSLQYQGSKNSPLEYELQALRKDGTRALLKITTSRINFGDKVASMGTVKDITEIKKTEEIRLENERLLLLSEAKNKFLMTMSHELRTGCGIYQL